MAQSLHSWSSSKTNGIDVQDLSHRNLLHCLEVANGTMTVFELSEELKSSLQDAYEGCLIFEDDEHTVERSRLQRWCSRVPM